MTSTPWRTFSSTSAKLAVTSFSFMWTVLMVSIIACCRRIRHLPMVARMHDAFEGSAFEHQRGHRVPKHMAGSVLLDAGKLDVRTDQLRQIIEGQRFTEIRHEDSSVIRLSDDLRARIHHILVDPP